MTKLIVYPSIEFEIEEPATKDNCVAFLLSKGFEDIENFHFEIDYIICTANYYGRGKPNFKMCLNDCSQYGEWIRHRGLDHQNLTSFNAEQLNELCRDNGRQR